MKHTIQIYGMHCKSCELLIKDKLNNIEGCKVNSISHKKGICEVEYANDDLTSIHQAILQSGYTLQQTSKQGEAVNQWVEKLIWLMVASVCIIGLARSDVSALIPNYKDLSLGIAFIIGLVASISTCLAVTGGIIIGYNESVQDQKPLRTQLLFQGGRILAFIIGGGILGAIGGQLTASLWFNAAFSIFIGAILLYLGLQLLDILPNISKLGFHLPEGLSSTIFKLKDPKYSPIVGALTFLLPCGFTQSMQLFALQSGSMITGASIMGAFATGTLPVLLSLGRGTHFIKNKLKLINPLIASLLVAFGAYTIYNGSVLTNSSINQGLNNSSQTATIETQTIQVTHNGRRFVPNIIKLKKGVNYNIVVTPSSDGVGCFYALAYNGKQYPIKKGQSFELYVNSNIPKTIPLVCAAMGMKMGEISIK